MAPTRSPGVRLKPLGHPSPCGLRSRPAAPPRLVQRRGWDSNPRGPFGPNALAGRRLKPLGHLSKGPARGSRPARGLPLLGSNQDSPDPESGVLPITPRGTVSSLLQDAGRRPVPARAGDGARTRDPQLGKLMLCQLSYSRRPSVAYPNIMRRVPKSHRSDLNRRPLDYESSALPLSYGGSTLRRSGTGRRSRNGAEGTRTPDLLGAIQALSQLSYSPVRVATTSPGPPGRPRSAREPPLVEPASAARLTWAREDSNL